VTTQQAQHKAATWFVQGKSLAFIAHKLSMSKSVVNKWKTEVRFLDMMGEIETIHNEISDYQLRALKRQAVLVLKKALTSPNPKEYQWAVSKLFSLPVDLLCSPTASRSQPLSPEDEDSPETDMPHVGAPDRQSLMHFLDSTRALDTRKTPVQITE
jgi:hypothetical protein